MLEKKYLFLLLLIVQNTSKTLIMRAAVGGKANFLYSAAVLATEGLKATASAVWVLNTGGSPASIVHFLRSEFNTNGSTRMVLQGGEQGEEWFYSCRTRKFYQKAGRTFW